MKYHCVRQYDATDCAAACLSTVCKQYGLQKSITKIRDMAGTDKNGTNGIGVIKAAKELGFKSCGVEIENKNLLGNKITYPCIAHIIKDGMNHYVVVHKATEEEIIVADPAEGLVKYQEIEFCKYWTGILFLLSPTRKMKEIKDDRNMIFTLLHIVERHRGMVSSIIITSLVYTILGIFSTLFFQFTFDEFIPNENKDLLGMFGLGFIICNIIQGLVQYVRVKLILLLGKKFDMELTFKSYKHIMELPMNFFALRQTGEIISRLNDSSKIRDALSGVTISAAVDTVMAVFCGIILFLYSKILFLVAVTTLVVYGLINLLFVKKIRSQNRKVLEHGAKVNSMFIETIKGVETIKACGAEKSVEEDSCSVFTSLVNSSLRCQDIQSFLGAVTSTICGIGYVIIIWIGANKVMNGAITVGTLLTFYSLMGYFLSPVQRIMDLQIELQGAIVAMERLDQLLTSEVEDKNTKTGISCVKEPGNIEINNINFRYGTRNLILKDVSLRIEKKEKIAIVGESGSGKTTLARILLGFYEYEKGDILFGGVSLSEINKEWLRSRIAYVSQEPYFFKGTIRDNLVFGNLNNPSEKEIWKSLEVVRLNEFIQDSPEGLNTKLQENALNLSGGQRQRLCLARALLRKPDILILDEATSNLDVITESSITRAMNRFVTMTTIIIAHRLSTIKKCDKIVALKNGTVVEQGTHKELMDRNGYYYSLWKEQE